MFTGIVEERGAVLDVGDHRLLVGCRVVPADSGVGASVAVNGTCLTVVAHSDASLSFDLSEETLERTSLGRLRPGDAVNLERPVSLAARLGGHMVQGHVDGIGEVTGVDPQTGGGARLRVRLAGELLRYVVVKGSISLDGVSLTVAEVHPDGMTVALIPHTLAVTTLGEITPGDVVNVEVDMIAKYVERLMEGTGR